MKSKSFLEIGIFAAMFGAVAWTLLHNETGKQTSPATSARNKPRTPGPGTGLPVTADSGDALSQFSDWRARRNGTSERPDVAEGVRLARHRLDELRKLMKSDPAAAIREMMPLDELAALPEEVRSVCEQPFSAMGDIDLLWATTLGDDGQFSCEDRTRVHANGQSWRAWGPRLVGGPMPRAHVPVNGWKLGGELLVAPAPVRRLGAAELAVAGQWFPPGNPGGLDPLTGAKADSAVAAVIGGRIFRFQNDASLGQVMEMLENADQTAVAEHRYRVDSGLGWLEAEGGEAPQSEGPVEATPWQDDMIDVLFVRVDFPDIPGEPVSKTALEDTLSFVNGHLHNYSYGKAALAYTVTSQLYRMPNDGADYAASNTGSADLIAAAKSKAAADYTLEDYDVVAVFFPDLRHLENSRITYSGMASVGGGNQWINGSNDVGVILHEFGHNFGLHHANYWDPSRGIGGSYNDPNHSSLAYGDIFDRMGGGTPESGYFSPYATCKLGWLPDSKVAIPRGNGTWRIHRFDDPNALSNQCLALRIPMGADIHYWVGHRKRYGAPYNLENGAYVVAEGLYKSRGGLPDRPNLIDMTPGSAAPETADRRDAGLPVGSSWNDPNAGVTIKVVASGGTAPNEWIDVAVTFESRISMARTSVEVDESSGVASVVLRREFSGSGAVSVDFATSDGTARAGSDYYAAAGTVKWADGETGEKTMKIAIQPDALAEGAEDFQISLSNVAGAVLEPAAGTTTISILDAGRRCNGFAPGFFNTTVYAIAPLPDGKIIIGGKIGAGIGGNPDIRHIARLNADGSVDDTFLTGAGFDAPVRCLALQPDGKIVVGGEFTQYNGTACNHVARLNADGTIDNGFVTATGAGADNNVNAVAVETGGTILVGGKFSDFAGSSTPKHMVRLASAGAPDTANPLNLAFSTREIKTILAQPDGKIMVGGIFFYYSWTAGDISGGMARLNHDGTRDTTFDPGDGAGHSDYANTITNVYAIARQADGEYLVGGDFTAFDGHPVSRLARLRSNGAFDASFSVPAFDNVVDAIVAQGNGMVVVGGWYSSPAGHIERLDSSGNVDPGFQQGTGAGGSVKTIVQGAGGVLWVGGNFFDYDGEACRPVIKIAGGVAPYDDWAARNFTAAQIAAGEAAETADPDRDGFVNLVELASGFDPNQRDTATPFGHVPAGGITTAENAGSQYLQVAFDKPDDAPGVWYAAQFSTDMVNWTPADPGPGGNTVYEVIEDSSAKFTVRDKTPADGVSRRFVRLVLVKPE